MKKRSFAILALIMSLVVSASVIFSGCNLITTNGERDLKQVIAEVNIGNEGQATQKIEKREMIMAYLNYGYYYVYNGQYTMAQAFEMIVDNLINTRIMSQAVMAYCEENNLVEDDTKAKWNVERYLGDEDIRDAKYTTIKSINDLIESYEEAEDEKYSDASDQTARTAPTGAANKETKLSDTDKIAYIDAGVIKGDAGSERRKAYNETLKTLQDNWLLGDSFKNDDLLTSVYYAESLSANEEAIMLENYEEVIAKQVRDAVDFETLSTKYAEMYASQKAKFTSASAFKTALDSASKDSPIVYAPYGGFGYVYNLLIGASADQTAMINAIETTDKVERADQRRAILNSTVAKDLRATWITSGYDFDTVNNKFTGDYTMVDDANAYAFQGEVEVLKEKTEKEAGEYRIKSVKEFGLDAFIKEIETYIYGADGQGAFVYDGTNPAVYYKANVASKPANYDKKINELIFAFSTDSGSLNTYKGYVVAPTPDLDGKETYMKEFATAGRELFTMGEGSYIVAATDYGYHFMFYSEIVSDAIDYPTLVAYLNALDGVNEDETYWADKYAEILEKWTNEEFIDGLSEAEQFLYNFSSKCADTETVVNRNGESIVKKYKYDKNCVTKHEKAYKDLLEM